MIQRALPTCKTEVIFSFKYLTVKPGKLWSNKNTERRRTLQTLRTSLSTTGRALFDQTEMDMRVKYDHVENGLKKRLVTQAHRRAR